MKKNLSHFSMALIIFFILSLILIVTFCLLGYNNVISPKITKGINKGLSIVLAFTLALLIGMKIGQKGFLIGIVINIMYLILISIIIGIEKITLDTLTIVLIVSRVIAIEVGSILGVNLANR